MNNNPNMLSEFFLVLVSNNFFIWYMVGTSFTKSVPCAYWLYEVNRKKFQRNFNRPNQGLFRQVDSPFSDIQQQHNTFVNDMVQLILILSILAIAALAMAVRMLFIKGSEMRAGCAGKNPMLQEEGVACGLCGAKPGEECKSDEQPA